MSSSKDIILSPLVIRGIIIKPKRYQAVLTGSNVKFTCETQAGSFEWFKEETIINADGIETTLRRHKINRYGAKIATKVSNGLTISELKLLNATTADSGIYECVLSYHTKEMEKNTRLYVHGKYYFNIS